MDKYGYCHGTFHSPNSQFIRQEVTATGWVINWFHCPDCDSDFQTASPPIG